jgi:hypothetical protein
MVAPESFAALRSGARPICADTALGGFGTRARDNAALG